MSIALTLFLGYIVTIGILEKTTDMCFSDGSCDRKIRKSIVKLAPEERERERESCIQQYEKKGMERQMCFELSRQIEVGKDRDKEILKCERLGLDCWPSFYKEPTLEELKELKERERVIKLSIEERSRERERCRKMNIKIKIQKEKCFNYPWIVESFGKDLNTQVCERMISECLLDIYKEPTQEELEKLQNENQS